MEKSPFISKDVVSECKKAISDNNIPNEVIATMKSSEPELYKWIKKEDCLGFESVLYIVYQVIKSMMERT